MRRYYICDCSGRLKFTKTGVEVMGAVFGLNGIDYRSIRTRAQLVKALLFLRTQHWVEDIKFIKSSNHEQGREHPDHDLIKEAIFGNLPPQEFKKAVTKQKKRSVFTVV